MDPLLGPALLLALWGAVVSLDERGLFLGGFAHPLIAGSTAGWLAGEPWVGLWTGFLFQAIWPARVESGGNVPPAGGLAAVGATAVAVALGVPTLAPGGPWLAAALLPENESLHGGFWLAIVMIGLALALAARAWEKALRGRNLRRERAALAGPEDRLGRAVGSALLEAGGRGAILVALPMLIAGGLRDTLGMRSPLTSEWLDAAAAWMVPAFLALGLGGVAWTLRRPARAAILDWVLGAAAGTVAAVVWEQLR
ncbi:MAG: PTS sugar transporter subunit IIC [Candidatus Eisenbacteria bacterium]